MLQTITITPKWQVYIPQKIREILGLTMPTKAKIKVEKNTIVLIPQKSKLLMMAGKYKDYARKKKIDLENIRDQIDYSRL
jgi:bifunctional DNA-binding transcriptional regulator/antitoxin component of YhaV-PrlF toxin-antitoxin module